MTRRQFRQSDHGVSIDDRPGTRYGAAPRWDDEARYSQAEDDGYARSDPRHDPSLRDEFAADDRPAADHRGRRAPVHERGARYDDRYSESEFDHHERRGSPDRRSADKRRTADSLDTMNAWIEKTQQQLSQTAEAASRQASAAEAQPSVAEAMAAIRRIEERLAQEDRRSSVRREADGAQERAADASTKPVGRRPLKQAPEARSAIEEIRSHQHVLERDPAAARRPSGLPALGTLARSQTAMLTTLKEEVSKLASRIEDMPRERPEDQRIQREVETLRQSMASVVRRDDLTRLEQGVQSLTDDILELRRSGDRSSLGSEIASLQQDIRRLSEQKGSPELAALQAEIRHLSEQRNSPDISALQVEIRRLSELRPDPFDASPISRDIENLSRKLDRVADSGVDPGVIASLTSQIEGVRRILQETGGQQSANVIDQQLSAIRRDIAEVGNRQIGSREVAELRDTVAELRASIGDAAHGPRKGDDVERTMRNLAQSIESSLSGITSRLERVDNSSIGTLSEQIDQVRRLLGEAGPGRSNGAADEQLAEIRRDLAEVVDRQINPREFAGLRDAVADLQLSLGEVASAPRAGPGVEDVARAMRDFSQPIETMLSSLVDKVERVERRVSDPEALDHLERQIEALTRKVSEASHDPAVAALENSMTEILGQVSSWRDGAIEAAERAARTAVAETIDSMPVASEIERHLMEVGDRYAAAEERTRQSLSVVQASISDMMSRLSVLEFGDAPREAYRPPSPSPRPVPAAAPVPPHHAASASSLLPEADEPFAPALDEEILLEPGSSRPQVRARMAGMPRQPQQDPSVAAAGAVTDSPDIKSSFIAAARRAAQAAAAESQTSSATKPRASAKAGGRGAVSPSDVVGRVRQLIDRKRRPLLLMAAAIVLALGTVQIVRNQVMDRGPSATVAVAPVPAKPAAPRVAAGAAEALPAQVERDDVTAATTPAPPGDPVTTQSISPAPSMATTPVPSAVAQPAASAKEPARIGESMPSGPAAQPPKTAALSEPSVILPVGIKQAADRGDPVALYELAVRTAEGRGVPRDLKAAAAMFTKAAEKGSAPAQYRIGNAYERGIGITRDIEQAKSWYRRAAMGGNVRAMHNLAVLLADGGGAKPDYAGAVEWFSRAAEHGVRDSQFNLAVLYARGLGASQDLLRAYHWLGIAALQGDEDAGKKRDEVGQRLSPADLAKAKEGVQRWRAAPAAVAANEVLVPPEGFPLSPATAVKRHPREARV